MKNIAVLSQSAFSALFITEMTDETVTVRYGYSKDGEMVYNEPVTLDVDYQQNEWSDGELEPCFSYQNWVYFMSEFMMVRE